MAIRCHKPSPSTLPIHQTGIRIFQFFIGVTDAILSVLPNRKSSTGREVNAYQHSASCCWYITKLHDGHLAHLSNSDDLPQAIPLNDVVYEGDENLQGSDRKLWNSAFDKAKQWSEGWILPIDINGSASINL